MVTKSAVVGSSKVVTMYSTKSNDQPSLAPTTSSFSIASSPSSSPLKNESNKKKSCNNVQSWSMHKTLIASLLSIFIALCPNDMLSFHRSSSTTSPSCSLNGNNDSDSCSLSTEIDIDMPPSSHHRGKVIGANVKAADLEAAYQSIKSEYAALALDPTSSTQWQVLSSHSDGSEVSLLQHPTDPSCPYVRMTSVMPGTIQDVWDYLDLKNWETSMPKMDPFYEGVTVLGDYKHKGINMKLARKTIKRIGIFGKRDLTFVSVSDHPRGDGAWVSGTVSVTTEEIPRKKGYVRAYQDSIAFYEAMDDEEGGNGRPQMKLTICFRLDLNDSRSGGEGGYIPMWIYVKTVGATGMASVQNMKRQLELIAEKGGNNDETTCDNNWLARIRNGTSKC